MLLKLFRPNNILFLYKKKCNLMFLDKNIAPLLNKHYYILF
jgi:hypothetical protein